MSDKIDQSTNFAKLPSAKCQMAFYGITVNSMIQKLKSVFWENERKYLKHIPGYTGLKITYLKFIALFVIKYKNFFRVCTFLSWNLNKFGCCMQKIYNPIDING